MYICVTIVEDFGDGIEVSNWLPWQILYQKSSDSACRYGIPVSIHDLKLTKDANRRLY